MSMRNVPNPEQYKALQEYAAKHGRPWKSDLNAAWSSRTDTPPLLQQVRNRFGPTWLKSFVLRTYRLEQISVVAKHYIIAAIWADAPEGTHPKATKESKVEAFRQCEKFVADCGPLFDEAMECFERGYGAHPDAGSAEAAFGHDYWLTRQGHGTGFWDRTELEIYPVGEEGDSLGSRLTDLCKHKEAQYEFYNGWFHLYQDPMP